MTPRPLAAGVVADAVTRATRTALGQRLGGPDVAVVPSPALAPAVVPALVPAPPAGPDDPGSGTGALPAPGAAAVLGGLVARLRAAVAPSGSADRWTRSNHRGEPVSLLEGPAVAAGLLAGGLVGAGGLRAAAAATVATAGGAAFGLVDDLAEDPADRAKGLRGHLGALAHGRLTTGALKVLGIGATGLLAAAVATPWSGPRAAGSTRGRLADVLLSGALVAGSANLANLLDLRPGRALKAAVLCAGPLALAGGRGAGVAGTVVGASTGALPADLAGRDMLGDGGANAVGALLGTAVVLDAPRPVRLLVLAGVVGLTLASERVSFTQVIADHPLLRELDEWGRPAAREGAPAASVAVPPPA